MTFVSQLEPKTIFDSLSDVKWVNAIHDELNQFTRYDVWILIPRTKEINVIGSKWVFKNKMDGQCITVRNKSRLVAQGYNQEEWIDYDETYAPVARLEAARLLLVYACLCGFKWFQMDVKSIFLNGFTNEEAYIHNPKFWRPQVSWTCEQTKKGIVWTKASSKAMVAN